MPDTNAASPTNALPPLIPRTVLFGNPEKADPEVSPDGTRLAYRAALDGVMNVWVRDLHAPGEAATPVTRDTTRPIRAYFWAENSRQIIYLQDTGGDENFHVFVVDVSGENDAVDLTPFPGVRASALATDPNQPDVLLIAMNKRDPQVMDVWRVSLSSGKMEMVAENPGNIVGWEADYDLRVRAAVTRHPDGTSDILVRDDTNAETPWRTLITFPFGESGGPISFSADNQNLYVRSNKNANTEGLYLADLNIGALSLVQERPDVDLGGSLFHPTTHALQAVSFTRARREWVVLDGAIAGDFAALQALTTGDFAVVSRSRDDSVWIVSVSLSDASPEYYLYYKSEKRAEKLFSVQPALDEYRLAPVVPVDILARDGLTLPSYLTLPVGIPAENLPFVLSVHGGPWARDNWGYSPFTQWLANRGYGVLQINFRGSTGFGKDFLNAGNREWAKKMHTDLLDGVQVLIDQKLADKNRISIMGGSYGGYATLVGLALTPDVFACGVDLVGPSDIKTLFDSIPPYWKPIKSEFLLRVGDPDTEPDFIRDISPLYHADKIVRPLLIAQGANDPRVKQAESDQIVQTMRENNQEVTYLLFGDEGHGFAHPENNLKFTAAAEAFLAAHLGGRSEPVHEGEEAPLVN